MATSVQILYEYAIDGRPHSSGVIRLLRPFSYPSIAGSFNFLHLREFDPTQPSEFVIVDRFWHPHDVTYEQVKNLVRTVRRAGSRLIYALDDNLLDLPREKFTFQEHHFQIVEYLLSHCDGILVTTPFLQKRLASYAKPIYVLQNSLDDRLLMPVKSLSNRTGRPLKIGYMGTFTHQSDIALILPALQAVARRHPEARFEFIGGMSGSDADDMVSGLPVTRISPSLGQDSYPMFMLWFTSRFHWDIALAPLEDNSFNQAKSDIKLLDYSAIGAAGIFSNVEAYQTSVTHGKNGLIVENNSENWEGALETLISQEDLRAEIAGNASSELHSQRILKVNAGQWIDALRFFGQQPHST